METRMPAEAFPPGDFIREELEERGWTQADLAEIIGRDETAISELVTGKRRMSPEIAQALADAFGTSAEFWMNLETAYQLWRLNGRDADRVLRARLWSKGPIREMMKRGWIEPSENVAVLERRVKDFFEIDSLDQEIVFLAVARMSTRYGAMTPNQSAWLYQARRIARALSAEVFTRARLDEATAKLRLLFQSAQEVRHVPEILAEAGIRFLVVEPISQSRIDGACFWLDPDSPVIVLSMRFDRLDYFWHTLLHEIEHVKNGHGAVDIDLLTETPPNGDDRPDYEQSADNFASVTLIPHEQLDNFVRQMHPIYPKSKIRAFAARMGVDPGIVVGQLQFRGHISYSNDREMLTKVRSILIQSALTDGWSSVLPAGR